MENRYTLIVSDNGSEWTKVYDGIGCKTFRKHFFYWQARQGVKLLAICPRETLAAHEIRDNADVRTYPGRNEAA